MQHSLQVQVASDSQHGLEQAVYAVAALRHGPKPILQLAEQLVEMQLGAQRT